MRERLDRACAYLADTLQVKNADDLSGIDLRYPYADWRGALKSEYVAAKGEWRFFGPIWHAGQAIKSWCAADEFTNSRHRADAVLAADFILRHQRADGLILAYEDYNGELNTSAILEALDGLFRLSDLLGDPRYEQAALRAVAWIADHAFLPEGLFRDVYDPVADRWIDKRHFGVGRPLLDDGVFLVAHRRTGERRYLDIAVAVANRLLRDERPEGNWMKYQPCVRQTGSMHPRQAFWWGKPMLDLWDATGNADYLFCFQRSVAFYRRALRTDGGIFRDTRMDFSTASHNQVVSASACAALMFFLDFTENRNRESLVYGDLALRFCLDHQFLEAEDPCLRGGFPEGLVPVKNTDKAPWFVRDLATIFAVQALAARLRLTV